MAARNRKVTIWPRVQVLSGEKGLLRRLAGDAAADGEAEKVAEGVCTLAALEVLPPDGPGDRGGVKGQTLRQGGKRHRGQRVPCRLWQGTLIPLRMRKGAYSADSAFSAGAAARKAS